MATEKELLTRSVSDLRAMARESGVRGFSRMTKAELIAVLCGKKAGRKSVVVRKKVEAITRSRPSGPKARRPSTRKGTGERTALTAQPTPEATTPVTPTHETRPFLPEDLGSLPDTYGEDRIVILPRDLEWSFIHWEVSEETWRDAWDRVGGGRPILRVVFEADDGTRDLSDAEVHPRQGRYYARVSRPGCRMNAQVGVLDGQGTFHPVVRSFWVATPAAGTRRGTVRFMTVPPDVPLRDPSRQGAEAVGRLLTEEEYLRLFGRGHPGSIPG